MITYETSHIGNTTKISAFDGGDAVGYGEILIALDCADVIDIEVQPNYRRRGIGREICKRLIFAAKSSGVETLTLEVRKNNIAAQNLYKSLDFCAISERKRYYYDNEDAIIMQLKIFL
jgi:ribosomal-protein-alanine N-acetyltransferase